MPSFLRFGRVVKVEGKVIKPPEPEVFMTVPCLYGRVSIGQESKVSELITSE